MDLSVHLRLLVSSFDSSVVPSFLSNVGRRTRNFGRYSHKFTENLTDEKFMAVSAKVSWESIPRQDAALCLVNTIADS